MTEPAIRFRIDFAPDNNLGPGKIALLEAVHATGSISDAARALNMSYRRAWLLASSLNEAFDEPVTVAVTGGKGGGGAKVTAFGSHLIAVYRALEAELTQVAIQRLETIASHVTESTKTDTKPARRPLVRKAVRSARQP